VLEDAASGSRCTLLADGGGTRRVLDLDLRAAWLVGGTGWALAGDGHGQVRRLPDGAPVQLPDPMCRSATAPVAAAAGLIVGAAVYPWRPAAAAAAAGRAGPTPRS
jgi:hypothetical protein